MSSLGDLLLGKVSDRSPSPEPNIKQEVAKGYQSQDQQQYHVGQERRDLSLSRDDNDEPGLKQRRIPQRNEDDDADEKRSNASSTDDYVRELLDPNDRPRNVWHVVEGPKGSPNGSNDGPHNLDPQRRRNSHSSPVSRDDDGHRGRDDTSNPNTQVKSEREEQMRAVINEARSTRQREAAEENDQIPSNLSPSNERKLDDHQTEATVKDDGSIRDKEHEHRHRDKRSDHHSSERRRHKDESRADRHRDDRRHHKSDKYKSRRSKYDDYSDDDDEEDYRYRKDRKRRRSRSRSPASRTSSSRRRDRSRSGSRSPISRDSRTVLVMQLSPRVVTRDLEDYFSEVGRVREVRLIMDSKTRRHKGIAYIEFDDAATAGKALALSGRKFHGVPLVIQSALSERNLRGDYHSSSTSNYNSLSHPTSSHSSSRSLLHPNSYRVYVGGLHVALTEEMLRSVFEPFGPLIKVELMKDRTTGISRGYAFLTYANTNDGMEAVRNLDGFELAGKNLRVSKSADKTEH